MIRLRDVKDFDHTSGEDPNFLERSGVCGLGAGQELKASDVDDDNDDDDDD